MNEKSKELARQINEIQTTVTNLTVETQEDAARASEIIKNCMDRVDAVKEVFKPSLDAQTKALNITRETQKKWLQPLEWAKQQVLAKVGQYNVKKQREAAEARAAEADRQKKIADEQAKKDAEALKSQGFHEEAKKVIENPKPIFTAPAPAVKQEKLPDGMHMRDNWKIEVVDVPAFKKEYPNLCQVDQKALNAMVKSQKQNLELNHCRVYNVPTAVQRRGK